MRQEKTGFQSNWDTTRGMEEQDGSGGFPERSKGSDCKSDGIAFAGSNPAPPNFVGFSVEGRHNMCRHGEIPAPSGTETKQAIPGKQLVFIYRQPEIHNNKGEQGNRRV